MTWQLCRQNTCYPRPLGPFWRQRRCPYFGPIRWADSNVMWREFVRKICDWERKNGALPQNMQQTLKVCILLRASLVLFEAIIAEYINDHKLCVFTCFFIPCFSFYFLPTSFIMAQWPLLGSAGPVKEDRGLTDKITPFCPRGRNAAAGHLWWARFS